MWSPWLCVMIRAEVNDNPRPFAVLEVLPSGGRHMAGTTDIPYRQTTELRAAHTTASVTYAADGLWHDLELNLPAEFDPFEFFRVPSIRTVGAVEVALIELHDPEPILPPFDPNAPIAAFAHEVDVLSIDFTDASVDLDGTIVSWAWKFGDGDMSTSQNPTHVYATDVGKIVRLTVTDDNGKTGIYNRTVVPDNLLERPHDS